MENDNPDLLIIEGWFLGIEPFSGDVHYKDKFTPNLSSHELSYDHIQINLIEYLKVWTIIEGVGLKPEV